MHDFFHSHPDLTGALQAALLIILLIAFVAGATIQQVFYSRLRRLHPSTWERLGRPVIFLSKRENTMAFVRYMWRGGYESLDNRGSVVLGRFLRRFLIFYLLYLVAAMVIGIAAIS